MVSEVGRLIDEFIQRQKFPPNASWVARQVGVSRSTVSHWYRSSVPSPEHLRRLAAAIETPYSRLVDAVMIDQGYMASERAGEDRGNTSPITAAEWDKRAAALQTGARPLSDAEVVQALGSRPGETRSGVSGVTAGQVRGRAGGRRAV